MIDEGPEGRRKRRLALPPLTFLTGLFAVAAIIIVVILLIYLLGGTDVRR
ncbi:MAG TPA: hypothetical protein VG079_03780 [Gaiellaceae bacterium]|nr:hypothetical protein [Gaiellaceae bacterium]